MDDLPAISRAQMEAVGGWTLGVLPHVRQRYRDDLRRVEEGIRPSLLPKQIGEESRPIIARDPGPEVTPAEQEIARDIHRTEPVPDVKLFLDRRILQVVNRRQPIGLPYRLLPPSPPAARVQGNDLVRDVRAPASYAARLRVPSAAARRAGSPIRPRIAAASGVVAAAVVAVAKKSPSNQATPAPAARRRG